MAESLRPKFDPRKEKLHEIIFEADTPAGKVFDVALLVFIVLSIVVVLLESVERYNERFGQLFFILEWLFTIFFTIEYILRLYCVYKPMKYATSFFGIIDLLAIAPTYLSLFFAGTHYFMTIRALRLLRVFRILKLAQYSRGGLQILRALRQSIPKITVFLMFVLLLVTVIGSVMYLVEGQANSGFTSIPVSIYWAIVTLTTVGFGDITPQTELGQFLSAAVMIMGYAVIAVPTGIVSAELISNPPQNTQSCRFCGAEGHDDDAVHCKYCGERLNDPDR